MTKTTDPEINFNFPQKKTLTVRPVFSCEITPILRFDRETPFPYKISVSQS